MSFNVKTLAVAAAAVVFSTSAVFAQAGGSDVPTDAKAKGTKENGSSSTGMSKGEASKSDTSKSGGSMEKSGGSMEKSK